MHTANEHFFLSVSMRPLKLVDVMPHADDATLNANWCGRRIDRN